MSQRLPKIDASRINFSLDQSATKSLDLQYRSESSATVCDLTPYLSVVKQEISRKRLPKCFPTMPANPQRQYFRVQTEPEPVIEQEDESKLIKYLQNDNEEPYEDQRIKDLIGKEAPRQYFQTFKKLDRVKDQNQFASISDSVQTSMLYSCDSLNLLPCKLGVVKTRGNAKQLDIPRRRYGNKYGQVLTEGLRNTNLTDFNLGYNRLEQQGASHLLGQITKQARSLELMSNRVGRIGCETIAKQISVRECKIEVLNLEDNSLGDAAVGLLCMAIAENSTLMSLNLAKNFINAVEPIREALLNCNSLEQLYLHWNQIKGPGAGRIFETLVSDCDNLRVLDVSYNTLGHASTSLLPVLNEFFKNNKTLVHLDLSANGFSFPDCQTIAIQVKQNRSIYGFHFSGNYGYVDSKGFIVCNEPLVDQVHVIHRILGVETLRKCYSTAERLESMKNICWICEGWHETTIAWVPGQSGDADSEPIFWHPDYEGYSSIFLGKPDANGTFSKKRMVPPGDLVSFFTAGDSQVCNQLMKVRQCPEKHRQKITILDRTYEVLLDEINVSEFPKQNRILYDWQPLITILPRTPDEIYVPARRKKQKRVWTFPISIWAKQYKFETTELLRQCFERDWACSKIPKFVKSAEELAIIMEMMWAGYKAIKETYKQYASYNPNGDVFSISQMPMSDFINNCSLIDGKQLRLADVDLKFIATCSASAADWKGNYRNPDRAIVRFQLMEFLVRLAEDKYVRGNQGVTMVQAVTQLMDQCKSHMSNYDANKWRLEKYFVEQCDDACKRYKWVFDYLYARNSSKKVKPGQASFMCLDELKDICGRAGLYEENFVDRDVNLAFNLSMMTQVDELDQDRIFQMKWIEFLEAVARIAEKLSVSPLGKDIPTYEKRFQQPLWYKLEALMVLFIKRMVDEDTKKNFMIPTMSMFDVVEEDEYY